MDKAKFFSSIRSSLFAGKLTIDQVKGMEAILEAIERTNIINLPAIAYIFATSYHETGRRMIPVREGFALTNAGAVAAVTKLHANKVIRTNYALRSPRTGQSYYGRGHVQLTWKENYKRLGDLLRIDLVNRPDLALDLKTSADILVRGMQFGLFAKGHDLARYMPSNSRYDFVGARRMINGTDKATLISQYADKFLAALT